MLYRLISQPSRDSERHPKELLALQDYTLGTIGFLLFLPSALLIALAIKLDSPGPILIRQRCHGHNGRIFKALRFRTVGEAEEGEASCQGSMADESMTRVGWFLCRTRLDVLPQFINVLRGEMSIVGTSPRPFTRSKAFPNLIDSPVCRCRVKPGMIEWG
jgi:putative colanic acid biosysnthesis UDP-glucose lipid carrier transferase